MKCSVVRSAEFRADLAEQAEWYVEQGGFELAERYGAAVVQTLARLELDPFAGRRRGFRAKGLKGLRSVTVIRPFHVHIVFYRVEGDVIQIFRVMHGARDLPRRLQQPPGSDD